MRIVLQRMVKPRVVTRPQVGKNPLAQNTHPHKRSPARYKERTKSFPAKDEVLTIFEGPHEAGSSRRGQIHPGSEATILSHGARRRYTPYKGHDAESERYRFH